MMMIKIQPSKDIRSSTGSLIFVIGATGIGKTTIASKAGEKVLIIDPEMTAGTVAINEDNVSVLHLREYPNNQEMVEIFEAAKDYDVVVFDSVNELANLAEDVIREKGGDYIFGGSLTMQGHALKGSMVSRLLRTVLKAGTNVIVTCSEEVAEDEGKEPHIQPILQRSVRNNVLMIAHLIVRLTVTKNKRVLITDKRLARCPYVKDRFNLFKPVEEPDLKKILDTIKNNTYEQDNKRTAERAG